MPKRTLPQIIGFWTGLSLFILLFVISKDSVDQTEYRMGAVAALMAVWWMTEAVPLVATSLLPLLLFPLLGLAKSGDTASNYINSTIFLFLGGFLLALGMERWNLHKRVSLFIIRAIGGSTSRILFGFMFSSALISMFISNTATAIMMMPIGLSIILRLEDEFGSEKTHTFAISLMLGIAYASSIGGIATLVGTVPNLIFERIFTITFPEAPKITFGIWMMFGIPISGVMLISMWLIISKILYRPSKEISLDKKIINKQYKLLGILRFEESILLMIVSVTALLWIFRVDIRVGEFVIPGWSNLLSFPDFLDDGTIAISMALLLFLIPSKNRENGSIAILEADILKKVPWDILLLFGGGFALAHGFQESGLSDKIGALLSGFKGVHPIFLIFIVCILLTFLTELTSNTATTNTVLPILASMSVAIGINPLLLMIPATLSASFAFMLPVATPPNAIVFGTGKIRISEMVRAGVVLNITGALILTLLFYFVGTIVFDIDPGVFPEWARMNK